MKVYLAGPMTGISEFNFPTFHNHAKILRELGHEVFSPAEHDEQNGFDSAGLSGHEVISGEYTLRDMLAADLNYICKEADAICLIAGWQKSRGVKAELATAAALDLWAGLLEDFIGESFLPAQEYLNSILRGGRPVR